MDDISRFSWHQSGLVLPTSRESFSITCIERFSLHLLSFSTKNQSQIEGLVESILPRESLLQGRAHAFSDSSFFLWSSPGQFMIAQSDDHGEKIYKQIEAQARNCSYMFDLSGSRVWLTLAGSCVKDVLANLCPLDLDLFGPNKSAACALCDIPINIFCLSDETPCFHILVQPSYASSVLHELHAASLEITVHSSIIKD